MSGSTGSARITQTRQSMTDDSKQAPLSPLDDLAEQAAVLLERYDDISRVIRHLDFTSVLRYHGDGYRDRDDDRFDFEAIIRTFLFQNLTDRNYAEMERYFKRWRYLVTRFGLGRAPTAACLSYTWRNRCNDDLQHLITAFSERLLIMAHQSGVPSRRLAPLTRDEDEDDEAFTDRQIERAIHHGQRYVYNAFDTERADNAIYDDECFFELQTHMGMRNCGTPQGASIYERRNSRDRSPDGDTHLRTIKKLSRGAILNGFDEAAGLMAKAVRRYADFRESVVVAIDITAVPFYSKNREGMPMVSGGAKIGDREYSYGHKYAVLSIVGRDVPLVLAIEPVTESSSWDDNETVSKHEIVQRLLDRASQHVDIHTVLCDRGFDAHKVRQAIDDFGATYLMPRRKFGKEKRAIRQMRRDGKRVAVESTTLHTELGSHEMNFLYVPKTRGNGDGTVVFVTNRDVSPDEAEGYVATYRRRWRIENAFKTFKNEFLAVTNSREYPVRLFYFAFATLLYNIWRVADYLLKVEQAEATGEELNITTPPVISATDFIDRATEFLRSGG